MTGTEIYKRTATYERQAKEIRLLAPHWKVLLAFDGHRTLSEVAIAAETSFAETIPLTQKFLAESWIEEQPITLEQYLKRASMRDVSEATAVAPPAVLHEPPKPVTPPAPAPAPTPVATPPPPLPTPSAAKAATPVEHPFVISSPVVQPPASKSVGRLMKLSSVVDFITSLVGNISIGQLLVYRVFLRVPPELLMAEDVASVYLVKDTSLIKTEALQKAIADAVNAVAKRALPDSVYVTA